MGNLNENYLYRQYRDALEILNAQGFPLKHPVRSERCRNKKKIRGWQECLNFFNFNRETYKLRSDFLIFYLIVLQFDGMDNLKALINSKINTS